MKTCVRGNDSASLIHIVSHFILFDEVHSSEGCKTSAIAEVSACNLNGFSTTHARGAICRACRTSESVAAVQKISGKDCVVG